MKKKETTHDAGRRDVLKKIAYITPVVLSLPAVRSFAQEASGQVDPAGADQAVAWGE